MTPSSGKRRIFLLSDHPIARYGMAQMINAERDIFVCGESETIGPSIGESNPALLIWDHETLDMAAEESVRVWHRAFPKVAILVTSYGTEFPPILRILRAGAGGYVGKKESLSQFLQGVRQTVEGKVYLNPSFGEQLISNLTRSQEDPLEGHLDRLTAREREILTYIGQGTNNREIAQLCHVSPKTVESHRLRIREKLGLRNSTELMRVAVTFLGHESMPPAGSEGH